MVPLTSAMKPEKKPLSRGVQGLVGLDWVTVWFCAEDVRKLMGGSLDHSDQVEGGRILSGASPNAS